MTTAVTTVGPTDRAALRADLSAAARTLAVVTLVGAASGAVVVGVLGRLAMLLLAVLNPEVAGVTSDDGFTIGQFTLAGSLQLLLSGVQLGVLGAWFYLVLRGLMVGPGWFRLLSISVGPAVVVGAMLVHTDGVDFTLLEPVGLAVGLFLALPGIYAALLHLGAERALASERALPRPALVVGLLPWLLLAPLTLVLGVGFLVLRALRRHPRGRAALGSSWPGWVLRGALSVVFVASVADLVRDLAVLA
jgi:hypothetical protein